MSEAHENHEEHECDETCGPVAIPIDPQRLMAMFGAAQPTEQDQELERMGREAAQLRWMNVLDTLDDEQVEVLGGMLGLLAAEGNENYRTFMIYGMFEREKYRRKITPDNIGKGSGDSDKET